MTTSIKYSFNGVPLWVGQCVIVVDVTSIASHKFTRGQILSIGDNSCKVRYHAWPRFAKDGYDVDTTRSFSQILVL